MQAPVYSLTGKIKSKLTLPAEIFAAKINPTLMSQAVRIYLSNQRQGSASAKTRSDVKGSRIKIYRQKGTGKARHGDRYAPIFVGGGVAHGPTGNENYKKTLSKSAKTNSLVSALSSKAKDKQVLVIDKLETIKPKTKNMAQTLQKVLTSASQKPDSKVSLILPNVIAEIIRASRNLRNVSVFQANNINTYQVLNGGTLIFMKPSIDTLKNRFNPNKTPAKN